MFLGGHEEGGDGGGLAPLSASEACSAEDLIRLVAMFFQSVSEEGGEVVGPFILVLVGLTGFDRRGARGSGAVRWVLEALVGAPKLSSTDGLNVCKSKLFVVVQVIE